MDLVEKKVLVTGASKGIGSATAVAFAKQGCSVAINYKKDKKAAEKVLDECQKHSGKNIIIQADISDEEAVVSMIKEIKQSMGEIDVLVNNAGIFDEQDSPVNLKAFERIYQNNFLGHVSVIKHALTLMKKGKIINVSSAHGKLGYGRPSAIAYSAFKAALESYTKNLAKELAPEILVNAVAPGRVYTPMWGKMSLAEQKKSGSVHLIKRMIDPEEIADGIIFLAKNDAMCAEILAIDGGYRLADLS